MNSSIDLIVICIKMHKAVQSFIRKELLSLIQSTWDDLPYKNNIEESLNILKRLVPEWVRYNKEINNEDL